MNSKFSDLVRNAEQTKRAAELADVELSSARRLCIHVWDCAEGKYNPIIHKAYETIDYYGHYAKGQERTVYVPERREDRWTRTCTICGLQENTTEKVKVVTEKPSFT